MYIYVFFWKKKLVYPNNVKSLQKCVIMYLHDYKKQLYMGSLGGTLGQKTFNKKFSGHWIRGMNLFRHHHTTLTGYHTLCLLFMGFPRKLLAK